MQNKESCIITIEKRLPGIFKGMVYTANDDTSAAPIFFQEEKMRNIEENFRNRKVPGSLLKDGARKAIEVAIENGNNRGIIAKDGLTLRWSWKPVICIEGGYTISDIDSDTRRLIAEQMLEQGVTEGSFTTVLKVKYNVKMETPGRDAFNPDSMFGLGVCYPAILQKPEYDMNEDSFFDGEYYEFTYFIDLQEMIVTVDVIERQNQKYYEQVKRELTDLVEKYSEEHDFTNVKVDTRWGGCSDSDDDMEGYQEDDDW